MVTRSYQHTTVHRLMASYGETGSTSWNWVSFSRYRVIKIFVKIASVYTICANGHFPNTPGSADPHGPFFFLNLLQKHTFGTDFFHGPYRVKTDKAPREVYQQQTKQTISQQNKCIINSYVFVFYVPCDRQKAWSSIQHSTADSRYTQRHYTTSTHAILTSVFHVKT